MTGVKESLSTWALEWHLLQKDIESWSRQSKTCSSKLLLQYNILLNVSSHLDVLWTNDETTSFVFLQDSHLAGCFTSSASCSSLIGPLLIWGLHMSYPVLKMLRFWETLLVPGSCKSRLHTKKCLHMTKSQVTAWLHTINHLNHPFKFQGFCLACQALPKVQHKRSYRWLWHATPWHENGMLTFATGTLVMVTASSIELEMVVFCEHRISRV